MELLIEIDPGELVDRLIIARMKEQACLDVAHVRKKQLKLTADKLQKLRSIFDLPEEIETELISVNLEIWELKNILWDQNSNIKGRAENILETLRVLSDRRAWLKREIDNTLGVKSNLFTCYMPDRLDNFALSHVEKDK